MVLIVSLGANGSVPVWFIYAGVPVAALALLLLPVAVPSTFALFPYTTLFRSPVLVTVKVKEVVPPVLPSFWITSSIASVAVSSFTIVPVPVSFVMEIGRASCRERVKVSVGAAVVYEQTGTVMVLIVSLGAKVSVPAWLM